MTQIPFVLALILIHASLTSGHKSYLAKIPNSGKVSGVTAIGHTNGVGGGTLTPFGEDFKVNGYKWDVTLCEKDSDKDGKSNGQELGDPSCKWAPGKDSILASTGITHPGVSNNSTSKSPTPTPTPAGKTTPSPENGSEKLSLSFAVFVFVAYIQLFF